MFSFHTPQASFLALKTKFKFLRWWFISFRKILIKSLIEKKFNIQVIDCNKSVYTILCNNSFSSSVSSLSSVSTVDIKVKKHILLYFVILDSATYKCPCVNERLTGNQTCPDRGTKKCPGLVPRSGHLFASFCAPSGALKRGTKRCPDRVT